MKKKYKKELLYYKGLVKEAHEKLLEVNEKIVETNQALQKIYALFNEIEDKLENDEEINN